MESFPLHRASDRTALRCRAVAGFTLIELLVVLGIITVITALVFTNQGSFNKTLILADTAYDVALSLRFAETYGVNSRSAGAGGVMNVGYGLDFQSAASNSFTLFADTDPAYASSANCHGLPPGGASAPDAIPGDCVYKQGKDQAPSVYTLGNGVTIDNFCGYAAGAWTCAHGTTGASGGASSLDIVFARPNPNPFMSLSGQYSSSNPVTEACISLTSGQGGHRYVTVSSSGEITANASSCP